MSKKNLLKAIKAAGYSHAEILEILEKQGILGEDKLMTEEEKLAVQKEKKEKEQKEEESTSEDSTESEEEEEEIDVPPADKNEIVLKEILKIKNEIKELRTKGIPLKTPSKGRSVDGEDLPEGAIPEPITKNKFEVRI